MPTSTCIKTDTKTILFISVCVSPGRTKDRKFLVSFRIQLAFRFDKNQLHARSFSKAHSPSARVIPPTWTTIFRLVCVKQFSYTRVKLHVSCVPPVPDQWDREWEIDMEKVRQAGTSEDGEEWREEATVMDRPISAARWSTGWEGTCMSTYRLAQHRRRVEWREEVMVGSVFG